MSGSSILRDQIFHYVNTNGFGVQSFIDKFDRTVVKLMDSSGCRFVVMEVRDASLFDDHDEIVELSVQSGAEFVVLWNNIQFDICNAADALGSWIGYVGKDNDDIHAVLRPDISRDDARTKLVALIDRTIRLETDDLFSKIQDMIRIEDKDFFSAMKLALPEFEFDTVVSVFRRAFSVVPVSGEALREPNQTGSRPVQIKLGGANLPISTWRAALRFVVGYLVSQPDIDPKSICFEVGTGMFASFDRSRLYGPGTALGSNSRRNSSYVKTRDGKLLFFRTHGSAETIQHYMANVCSICNVGFSVTTSSEIHIASCGVSILST